MDDAEAVRLTRSGDRRGPEALLERYQREVYGVALRMLREPAAAEDATQDTFLRAFSRLSSYRDGDPFGAWLQGIVRNRCLDVIRSGNRVPSGYVDPPVRDAEVEALGNLEGAAIRAALETLPERDRSLLVMRYWEDRPVEDIARRQGMTAGAVRVALLRARRSFAGQLATLGVSV